VVRGQEQSLQEIPSKDLPPSKDQHIHQQHQIQQALPTRQYIDPVNRQVVHRPQYQTRKMGLHQNTRHPGKYHHVGYHVPSLQSSGPSGPSGRMLDGAYAASITATTERPVGLPKEGFHRRPWYLGDRVDPSRTQAGDRGYLNSATTLDSL
jgi:hypothetical protein